MRIDRYSIIIKIKNTLLRGSILLQAVLLCGCNVLHEDLSECDLFLKFKYDYNMEYQDWFKDHVEEVKVFVFDKDGRFVQMFQETSSLLAVKDFKMKIPFQMKGYTAIVWAGNTEQDYTIPQMNVGDRVDQLTLKYEPENNISARRIAALWHSGPHIMTFPEAGGVEQTISLIRNTNDFKIGLRSNKASEPISNYDITIKGANGSYDYKNDYPIGISNITYRPADDNQQTANIYTLRLVEGAPLIISAKDKSTDKNILIEGEVEANLTELLLKNKPEKMGAQEYLDRRYIWDISLNYSTNTYIAISITINGWVYWFQKTDL